MERATRIAPRLLLGAALLIAAVVTLVLVRHLTFFADSWEFLMNRRHLTASAVFEPHNEHIVVIPVLITQLFLRIFGMTSAMPEFVLLTIALLATSVVLYLYVERRIGSWPALFAATLVLFLGPAYEVLLWTFEISFVGSMLFGLVMLLALERCDRRGDVIACVALLLCFGFSSLGIAFAVAGAVAIMLGPRQSWRERAFTVAVPVALYALWWIGWGHNAETHFTLQNLLASPRYVAETIAVGVGALSGLGTEPATLSAEPVWGRTILIALIAAVGLLIYRRKRVDPIVWPTAAAAIATWFLTAFNEIPGREPTASRYQYVSAIFILMILAGLLRGSRLGKRTLLVGGLATAFAIAPNLVVLHKGREFFAEQTILTRSDTAALEIARRTVSPEFAFTPEVAGTGSLIDINAAKYFEAIREFGSPAYSQGELERAVPQGRRQADILLTHALSIAGIVHVGGFSPAAAAGPACNRVGGVNGTVEAPLAVGVNRIEVPPGTEATPSLRRFTEGEYPVPLSAIPSRSAMLLRIPGDESSRPWYVHVDSSRPVEVCG
ncbi:MAG: hypothetical protein WB507_13140 [Solirubrobacterales bacterium]